MNKHDRPKSEVELSPYVINHFKSKGYCVHGEVAVFKKSTFIDHVAHLGPCDNPTKVIAIEMKNGAGKSLRNQVISLDTYHVADEIWGVSISNPRKDTLEKWKAGGSWHRPGLLVWNKDGTLKTLHDFRENRKYKRGMKKGNLLLIDRNKGCLAGYPSGGSKYYTHWSVAKDHVERCILGSDGVSKEDIFASIPTNVIRPYKRKKSAVTRILKVLVEDELKICRVKVATSSGVYYVATEAARGVINECDDTVPM